MTQQNSANLSLPYIQPSQAQKHVTHNEAIRLLDALVQAVVQTPPQDVPPTGAAEGERYLTGTAPTGDWSGQANRIAWRTDGAWSFIAPQPGWAVRVVSDGSTRVWLNGAWQTDGLPQVVSQLGIDTSADATNRLAVASDATLLTHAGGGHQVKVNKSTAGETASLLFQSGFSGRAEMGLGGSDAFAVKVSADGSTWFTGLEVDPTSGGVSFPNGASIANRIDLSGRWACYDGAWTGMSTTHGASNGAFTQNAGNGAEPALSFGQMGPMVPGGARLSTVTGGLRRSDAEITAADLRIVFQNGAWDGTWDTDGETTRTVLWSADNVTLGTGWERISADLANWTAPNDGFVLMFLRPVGTLTETRYVYASVQATYLTPV